MKAPGFAAASALRAALLTIATIALASFEAHAQSAAERIAALLEGSGAVLTEAPHLPRESLRRLYEARGGAPLWVEGNMPSPTGWAMASLVFRAGEQGLNPEKYYASQIQARALTRTERSAAELDLLLSAGLLGYAADLGSGRLEPKKTDPELFAYPDPPDPVATLLAALESGDPAGALAALAPPHEGYRRLRGLLARYRTIADAGGWPQVADGAKLERGDQGPRVETLRRRLAATGDLDSKSASGALFDETLAQAVERIQARLGLEVDGIVGKNTLAALNTSVEQRIRQIQVNMERWRWLPRDLGKRHIFINAADFRLALVEAGSPVLEMRVVVGRPYRRTPQFSENMNYIIVNPDWTVPPKLARQDILPKVRENPSYLAEHNFTVFSGWSAEARRLDPASIDWPGIGGKSFPYKLVQAPGPNNALGRIKFMLPNRYNVYLHDTPSRELFDRTTRAFSSGCVRLAKPLELADHLLRDQPDWDPSRLRAAIDSGRTMRINLPVSIPVYFTYFTAWVDDDGTVQFRNDIYDRDASLYAALRDQLIIQTSPPVRPGQ